MLFRDIPGNIEFKKSLINTVTTGRISHALLFVGQEGNAKLSYALAYAQYLSCTNRQADDACGECPSCKKYAKRIHPDLHFVFPVVSNKSNSKPVSDDYLKVWRSFLSENIFHSFNKWTDTMGAENKQAGIFAQESASIIRKLNFKTFESKYKVMIIWLPEKMNITASNKLLKMIEEPPTNTNFLLVSEKPNEIISTILSRTQPIRIPKADADSLENYFSTHTNIDNQQIKEAITISENNGIKILEHLNEEQASTQQTMFDNFQQMMRLAYKVDIKNLIAWADNMATFGREQNKVFLNYALRMVRENFILNVTQQDAKNIVFLTRQEKQFSEKFSIFIHKNNIEKITNELNLATQHIERNGYNKLIFLDLALKISKALKVPNT